MSIKHKTLGFMTIQCNHYR